MLVSRKPSTQQSPKNNVKVICISEGGRITDRGVGVKLRIATSPASRHRRLPVPSNEGGVYRGRRLLERAVFGKALPSRTGCLPG